MKKKIFLGKFEGKVELVTIKKLFEWIFYARRNVFLGSSESLSVMDVSAKIHYQVNKIHKIHNPVFRSFQCLWNNWKARKRKFHRINLIAHMTHRLHKINFCWFHWSEKNGTSYLQLSCLHVLKTYIILSSLGNKLNKNWDFFFLHTWTR